MKQRATTPGRARRSYDPGRLAPGSHRHCGRIPLTVNASSFETMRPDGRRFGKGFRSPPARRQVPARRRREFTRALPLYGQLLILMLAAGICATRRRERYLCLGQFVLAGEQCSVGKGIPYRCILMPGASQPVILFEFERRTPIDQARGPG